MVSWRTSGLVAVFMVVTAICYTGVGILWICTPQVEAQPEISMKIVTPRFGAPSLAIMGDTILVEVNLTYSDGTPVDAVTKWQLNLRSSQWSDIVFPVTYIPTYKDKIWSGTITLNNIIPGLYDIEINAYSNGNTLIATAVEHHALKIYESMPKKLRVIQLTDIHIGDLRGAQENIQETINWKAAKKAIAEINLLNPDFVILTGDVVFGQNYRREYPAAIDVLMEFNVPLFVAMGNHDGYLGPEGDGYEFWQEYFAPLYYSFDFGNYHFVALNTYDWDKRDRMSIGFATAKWGGQIREQQLAWLEKDLLKHKDRPIIMFGHHNPLWISAPPDGDTQLQSSSIDQNFNGEGREELLALIYKYDTVAYLAGHLHYDNVTIINNTVFITTTTAASSHPDNAYWGYRYMEFKDHGIGGYDYDGQGRSIPSYHLNYTISLSHSDKYIELNIESSLNIDFCEVPISWAFTTTEARSPGTNKGTILYEYLHENYGLLGVSFTIPHGKSQLLFGYGIYCLIESTNNNEAFLAVDLNGPHINDTTFCILIMEEKTNDIYRYSIISQRPMHLSILKLNIENTTNVLAVDVINGTVYKPKWLQQHNGTIIYDINLIQGTTTVVLYVSNERPMASKPYESAKPTGPIGGPVPQSVFPICVTVGVVVLGIIAFGLVLYINRWWKIRKYGY